VAVHTAIRSTLRSPLRSVTRLLVVVMLVSLGFAAVSIAYAAGRHDQLPAPIDVSAVR